MTFFQSEHEQLPQSSWYLDIQTHQSDPCGFRTPNTPRFSSCPILIETKSNSVEDEMPHTLLVDSQMTTKSNTTPINIPSASYGQLQYVNKNSLSSISTESIQSFGSGEPFFLIFGAMEMKQRGEYMDGLVDLIPLRHWNRTQSNIVIICDSRDPEHLICRDILSTGFPDATILSHQWNDNLSRWDKLCEISPQKDLLIIVLGDIPSIYFNILESDHGLRSDIIHLHTSTSDIVWETIPTINFGDLFKDNRWTLFAIFCELIGLISTYSGSEIRNKDDFRSILTDDMRDLLLSNAAQYLISSFDSQGAKSKKSTLSEIAICYKMALNTCNVTESSISMQTNYHSKIIDIDQIELRGVIKLANNFVALCPSCVMKTEGSLFDTILEGNEEIFLSAWVFRHSIQMAFPISRVYSQRQSLSTHSLCSSSIHQSERFIGANSPHLIIVLDINPDEALTPFRLDDEESTLSKHQSEISRQTFCSIYGSNYADNMIFDALKRCAIHFWTETIDDRVVFYIHDFLHVILKLLLLKPTI